MNYALSPKRLRALFRKNGSLRFEPGKKLRTLCRDVPHNLGVYLIRSGKTLLYIGKAGGIRQDGQRTKQGLYRRLNGKHGGLPTQKWFLQNMQRAGRKAIDIEWFVTYDGKKRTLPVAVESSLIQWFFLQKRTLPDWHRAC